LLEVTKLIVSVKWSQDVKLLVKQQKLPSPKSFGCILHPVLPPNSNEGKSASSGHKPTASKEGHSDTQRPKPAGSPLLENRPL